MTLNFSGRHYPKEIILQSLRYYLAYKLSYREIRDEPAARAFFDKALDSSGLSSKVVIDNKRSEYCGA